MSKGLNKVKEFVDFNKRKMVEFIKDEKAGPGIEEAFLLVFIGLVIADAANDLGGVIDSAFDKGENSIKTKLSIT